MRLIDADALFMENMRTMLEPLGNGQYEEVKIVYFRDIENAPTIDAVPVVRCEDCVYRPCKQMPHSYDLDYCSYGEMALDDEPTIDPVKHGRWVHESLVSTGGGTYDVVRCSCCKSQFPLYETNYCPNCGARMDGDEVDKD